MIMGLRDTSAVILRKNGGLQNVTDTDDLIYLKSAWMNGFRAK